MSERIRATDPARLTVLLPDPAFGEAMEIDYGRLGLWTDPLGRRRLTIWVFVATLRASGMHFVRPVLRMDSATWITCHVEALRFFGDCARFWIPDNLKAGVLAADLYDPRQTLRSKVQRPPSRRGLQPRRGASSTAVHIRIPPRV